MKTSAIIVNSIECYKKIKREYQNDNDIIAENFITKTWIVNFYFCS